MTEEDSWDPDSSSDDPEGFPQDIGSRENAFPKKREGFLEDSIDYLSNIYAPDYFSMPICSCKPDQEAKIFQNVKPYHHRTKRYTHGLQEPCDAPGDSNMNAGEVITFAPMSQHQRRRSFAHGLQEPCDAPGDSNMNAGEVITFAPMPQRKKPQQFGQENKAAAIIQSAWRNHHAIRNMDRMNKAATQIQANIRGYLTRKELPLGLPCYSWTTGGKKTRTQRKSHSSPTFLNSPPGLHLDFGSPFKHQSICFQSHEPRHYTKNVGGDYPRLNHRVCCEGASAVRPSTQVCPYHPFNVLAPQIQEERYQDAASTIQAAWKAYQSRQRRRPLLMQVDGPPFHSNFTIKQASWGNAMLGCAFEQQEIQQIFANSNVLVLDKAPRVRNINIYTVVKGLPATSSKPNISVEVKSPHVSIQGFQRDMPSGVQAVYTVRNPNLPRASQIHVHVNMKKGKALK